MEDFFDTFFGEFGWVTVLVVLGFGGIVFGFIEWIWWAMLLILLGILFVIGFIVFFCAKNGDSDVDDEEEKKEIENTSYKCDNCGAPVSKIISYDDYGVKKVKYKCTFCNTCYSKNQVLSILDSSKSISVVDLDDWEEEYFEVCDLMFFRPYNKHTMKQIDRKHEKLKEKIDNFEEPYGYSSLDDEDILNNAYDFFSDNQDEIEEYFKKFGEEEIRKRYDFYTKYNSIVNDED